MPYLGRGPGFGIRQKYFYTASADDTSVSGSDDNNLTLTFTDGLFIDVYLNGVLLDPNSDYNTTTANTVAGLAALSANDFVEVVAYDSFSIGDVVPASSGGTFSGAINVNGVVTGTAFTAGSAVLAEAELELLDGLTAGTAIASKVVTTDASIDTTGQRNLTISGELDAATLDISGNADIDGTTNLDVVDIDGAVDMASTLQVDGAITSSSAMTITTADNDPQLTLVSTDADGNEGPVLNLYRNSASPADDDNGPRIKFTGKNDAGEDVEYARLRLNILDMTDGTEDGTADFSLMKAGSLVNIFTATPLEFTFNDGGDHNNFRIENNTKTHQLFMNGSNGRFVMNADDDELTQSSHFTLLFASASYSAFAGRMTDNGSGAGFLICRNSAGSTIGQVKRNGTSDAVQYVTTSDYRLKENVNYNWDGTTELKKLKPCRYNWINDESNDLYDGFLAHEVQDVVPCATTGEKDAVDDDGNIEAQGIDQSLLVPLLVKTIQELEARITALEDA